MNTAEEFSKRAREFLATHKLSPHPVNFAVAYAIAKGERSSMLKAYQQRLEAEGQLTEFIMRELFDNYFACSNEQAMDNHYEGLQGLLAEVVHEMAAAATTNDEFSDQLQGHIQKLHEHPEPGEIVGIVRCLISSTEEVRKTSSELSSHLANVQREANQLKGELQRTKNEATIDALTGLQNRKALQHSLGELMTQAQREPSSPIQKNTHCGKLTVTVDPLWRILNTKARCGSYATKELVLLF